MEWKDLAPWIAIAITLVLSILVPLFTQMANNAHQRKMQKEKLEYEKLQEKEKAYKEFLQNVGATVVLAGYASDSARNNAGASLHKLYLYAPSEWWGYLDSLSTAIKEFEWAQAKAIMEKLSKLIAQELNNYQGKLK